MHFHWHVGGYNRHNGKNCDQFRFVARIKWWPIDKVTKLRSSSVLLWLTSFVFYWSGYCLQSSTDSRIFTHYSQRMVHAVERGGWDTTILLSQFQKHFKIFSKTRDSSKIRYNEQAPAHSKLPADTLYRLCRLKSFTIPTIFDLIAYTYYFLLKLCDI